MTTAAPKLGDALRRVAIALVGLLCAFCAQTDRSSVVLITIDTLRADRLSAYGFDAPSSPTLDALAQRGILFEAAFSTSASTAPSHASILTGRYPSFHSVGVHNGQYRLDASAATLAEALRDRGYRTAAIISNPVLKRSLGLDQGFDHYDDALDSGARALRDADGAVDQAIAWIEAGEGPFFLWLHLQDPHGPYTPPQGYDCSAFRPALRGRLLRVDGVGMQSGHGAIPHYQYVRGQRHVGDYEQRYACELSFADREIGRLVDYFDALGRFERTLFVVTSDHGEAFGEDGYYFAHSHSVGLDQVRVPLIVAGAGIEGGRVVSQPVSNVLTPGTVLEALGLPHLEGAVRGSLLAVAKGHDGPAVFVETLNQVGIVHDNSFLRMDRRPPDDEEFWRLNPNSGGFWKPLGRQLVRPLDERRGPPAHEVSRLEEELAEFEQAASAARAGYAQLRKGVELSDEERRQLEELGYMR